MMATVFGLLLAGAGSVDAAGNWADADCGDTVVSNVPGPRDFLYLKDARVEEMCPVSTLLPGSHLNITLFSYAGTLEFGLVATQELGDLERLARYMEKAFFDLEEAVFNPPPGARKTAAKRRRKGD